MPRYEMRIIPYRNDGNGVLHEALITVNAQDDSDATEIAYRFAQLLNGVLEHIERS